MAGRNNLQSSDFVHLHNHTQYSLLDGLTKVPLLINRIQELGMEAVAITDHGTLSGAIEFYQEAKSNNIKPIIGMETYVAATSHTSRDPGKDKIMHHLILLAMNLQGYQNLMRLSTIANLEGFYYKPRIDHDLLEQFNEGLIVLSGCIGGEVGDALRQGQYEQAKQVASWYKSVFSDRYYLEIQDHGHKDHPHAWKEQVGVTELTFKLASELKLQCVITSDAHYLKPVDQEAHEILLCVQTGSFLSDEKRMSLKEFELHVTDPTDIIKRWGSKYPEAIINTSKIAARCDLELALGNILIPKFDIPSDEGDELTYLEKLTYRGLAWRYGDIDEDASHKLSVSAAKKLLPKPVMERARYELGVIESMKFCGYFLIISDFINWGKNQDIVFGPGRGSAAGSIIAYALKITELDPLKYDLLFERFLNPDRISMPDIDIDIQDSRRDEVIQYCTEKYGSDRVANIVTFGRMAARNAVRDVARVLQVPYTDADRLAKMIPPPVQGRHIPLEKSIEADIELKNEYENNEVAKRVFDLAIQLEGTIRSHGVHAAGVVIAPDELVKYAPLEKAQKGVVATQYSMGPIEDLGLLKIDFLGLSNLTIINNALRIIKKVFNEQINITDIPLDDVMTFELLARGDTTGVFQLESAGMKRYLKELKPTVFDDIVAMVALYRPGPMQWIEDFIARKHGRREIEYFHPAMRPALENTYGVIVYQEQVMQIAKDMCGFTGGQADTLRKGIGKKIPAVLAKMKPEFIKGAVNISGADAVLMEKFWKQIEAFGAYCFNKSHAACYGLIAYQTAYLKAHYPAAYMAALMTSDFDNTDRLAIEINECKHMGIEVQPPDVNESYLEFAVVPERQQIRFGLAAIKNVGTAAVEEILRARENGTFESLEDFFGKVDVHIVNRKALESLIKAGAFDRFGSRDFLLFNLDVLLAFANRLQKQTLSGQTDLFGASSESSQLKAQLIMQQPTEVTLDREQLAWERELLGIYLSQHPLEPYEAYLTDYCTGLSILKPAHDKKKVTVGGAVVDIREITAKNGQKMGFVKIADLSNELELILFPSVYQKYIHLWHRDKVVVVKGKVSSTDKDGNQSNEVKLLVDEAYELTPEYISTVSERKPRKTKSLLESKQAKPKSQVSADPIKPRLYIRLHKSDDHDVLLSLRQTINDNRGETEVVLVVGGVDTKQIIRLPIRVETNDQSLGSLGKLVGAENIKLH